MSRNQQRKKKRRSRKRPRSKASDIGIDFIPRDRETLSDALIGGTLPVLPMNPIIDHRDVRHDSEARLATGIRIDQLVRETERWWTSKGRKAASHSRRSQVRQRRGVRTNWGPFTLDPDDGNFLPSGLIHGWPWDRLSKDEKLRCVKAYHEIRYAKPKRQAEGHLPSIIMP